jgi:uncharacterized membrane protein
MDQQIDKYVPKVARNELFYFIARMAIIVAVPLGGFFGMRLLALADALQVSVAQQNTDIRVLTTTVELQHHETITQLSDHELRLRAIERAK